jgi:ABC-type dipeptide/oligopeptide/nickel transport system permease component
MGSVGFSFGNTIEISNFLPWSMIVALVTSTIFEYVLAIFFCYARAMKPHTMRKELSSMFHFVRRRIVVVPVLRWRELEFST